MIDFIYTILLAISLWKGITRGLIVAVCSFAAVIIGLAAAIKLSAVVAGWLQKSLDIGSGWLPFLSFLLVMVVVVLVVRMIANFLENSLDAVKLGWLNKVGGFALYALLFTMVYSVVLFFANQLHILTPAAIQSSRTYGFIAPWGPTAVEWLGKLIPVFKNVFGELESFFEQVGTETKK